MPGPPYKNTILSRLGPEIVSRLHLTAVNLPVGREIEFPGHSIDHIYFVEEGMASMTACFKDGSQVEVGMFGYESVIGISALMGSKRSLNHVYTQVAGRGFQSAVDVVRIEFGRGGKFQTLALRYVQSQLLQTAQAAGCNARHDIEQRLARWLLITADQVNGLEYHMSQDFLSHMIGNTRTSVSRAAVTLKDEGLIDYTRGLLRILDRPGLERRCCECYAVVKDHLENNAEFEDGNTQ